MYHRNTRLMIKNKESSFEMHLLRELVVGKAFFCLK